MRVAIQHYQPSYRAEKLTEVSAAQLEEILHRVAVETGSTLEVKPAHGEYPSLIVAVDAGRFTVTAIVGPDAFYDRLGDPNAVGSVALVIGGQLIDEVPARFVLNLQQVREVTGDYAAADRFTIARDWVRQGLGPWK